METQITIELVWETIKRFSKHRNMGIVLESLFHSSNLLKKIETHQAADLTSRFSPAEIQDFYLRQKLRCSPPFNY